MQGVLGTLLLVHQPGRHPRVVLLEVQNTIHLDLRLIALRARQVDDGLIEVYSVITSRGMFEHEGGLRTVFYDNQFARAPTPTKGMRLRLQDGRGESPRRRVADARRARRPQAPRRCRGFGASTEQQRNRYKWWW